MSSDLPDGYELSTDPARLDVDQLHQWLSVDAYWALGRSRDAMETAIATSLNFGVYDTGSGAQGAVGVRDMDLSADGTRLVAIGNFKRVDGLSRDRPRAQ